VIPEEFRDRVWDPERVRGRARVEADAVVVGTGAGGAAAARELAEGGLSVALLEEGDYRTARDYGSVSALEAIRMLYRKGGFTFTTGNASVLLPSGCCVGGTTVINSGTALRALPEAVDRWREEFGLWELSRGLEGYYARVAEGLGVAPVPEPLLGKNGEIFRREAERAGRRAAVLHRAARGCRGAGRCFLGCPNDAKQATHLSYVPRALARGARLFVRARAERVVVEGRRAAGVQAVLRPREGPAFEVEFRAPAVVLAAGAIYTPLLLAPVRGRRGRGLGAHLRIHPASRVVGLFDEEVRGWEGVPQGYHLEESLMEGFSIEGIFVPPSLMSPSLPEVGAALEEVMDRYNHLGMLGYRVLEEGEGRVLARPWGRPAAWPLVWYWLRRSDAARLARAAAVAAEILRAAGARKVFTAIRGFEVLTSEAEIRLLREARPSGGDMELSAYHAQRTARMADSPDRGVVDPWGQVWGLRGLYVADASLLPFTPGTNPQVSIMAFATHVAAGILARLGRAPVLPVTAAAVGGSGGSDSQDSGVRRA
jgi:choline dehydrogenase-like flavoprotein